MNIGDLARAVDEETLHGELIDQFEQLIDDEWDCIKILTVDHLHDIAEIFPNSDKLIQITRKAI